MGGEVVCSSAVSRLRLKAWEDAREKITDGAIPEPCVTFNHDFRRLAKRHCSRFFVAQFEISNLQFAIERTTRRLPCAIAHWRIGLTSPARDATITIAPGQGRPAAVRGHHPPRISLPFLKSLWPADLGRPEGFQKGETRMLHDRLPRAAFVPLLPGAIIYRPCGTSLGHKWPGPC